MNRTETLTVTHTRCGFCTARNHCTACGEELARALAEKPGVIAAQVDIPKKTLRIEYRMDREDLEDLLDRMGLIVD